MVYIPDNSVSVLCFSTVRIITVILCFGALLPEFLNVFVDVGRSKNLSENQDFGKDQLSTGKVKESEVMLPFFLESVPGADANDGSMNAFALLPSVAPDSQGEGLSPVSPLHGCE